jgi:hypothetical protein
MPVWLRVVLLWVPEIVEAVVRKVQENKEKKEARKRATGETDRIERLNEDLIEKIVREQEKLRRLDEIERDKKALTEIGRELATGEVDENPYGEQE